MPTSPSASLLVLSVLPSSFGALAHNSSFRSLSNARSTCTVGAVHADCTSTGCCADPTLACYKRPTREHAECRPREPHCSDSDEWLCPGWELCSKRFDSCTRSQCCQSANDECYQKHAWYAQCYERDTCAGKKDPHTNVPWLCSVLHEPEICSADWQECTSTKCCSTPGFTCFEKNENYARCMRECPDPASSEPFSCNLHDRAQVVTSALVSRSDALQQTCSPNRGECTVSGCCQHDGFTCYEKGPNYSECLRTGSCEDTWPTTASCTARAPPKGVGCGGRGGDCSASNCCSDSDYTCFQKDAWSHIAKCMRGCSPGSDGLHGWECNVLNRSPPPAPPAPPPASLFRATYGTTCSTFKSRVSIHSHACDMIKDEATCSLRFREASTIAPTTPGRHVLEPCVWFQNTCATGGPVECTPAQVTYVQRALPQNAHSPQAFDAARDAAEAQGASSIDEAAHILAGSTQAAHGAGHSAHSKGNAHSSGQQSAAAASGTRGVGRSDDNDDGGGDGGGGIVLAVLLVLLLIVFAIFYRRQMAVKGSSAATKATNKATRKAQDVAPLDEAGAEDSHANTGAAKKKKFPGEKKTKVEALAGQAEDLDMEL